MSLVRNSADSSHSGEYSKKGCNIDSIKDVTLVTAGMANIDYVYNCHRAPGNTCCPILYHSVVVLRAAIWFRMSALFDFLLYI